MEEHTLDAPLEVPPTLPSGPRLCQSLTRECPQADLKRLEGASSPRSRLKKDRACERKRTVRRAASVHFGTVDVLEISKLSYEDVVGDIRDRDNPNYGTTNPGNPKPSSPHPNSFFPPDPPFAAAQAMGRTFRLQSFWQKHWIEVSFQAFVDLIGGSRRPSGEGERPTCYQAASGCSKYQEWDRDFDPRLAFEHLEHDSPFLLAAGCSTDSWDDDSSSEGGLSMCVTYAITIDFAPYSHVSPPHSLRNY